MNTNNINSAFAIYQYASGIRKATTGKIGFAEQLTSTAETAEARVDTYKE